MKLTPCILMYVFVYITLSSTAYVKHVKFMLPTCIDFEADISIWIGNYASQTVQCKYFFLTFVLVMITGKHVTHDNEISLKNFPHYWPTFAEKSPV